MYFWRPIPAKDGMESKIIAHSAFPRDTREKTECAESQQVNKPDSHGKPYTSDRSLPVCSWDMTMATKAAKAMKTM